MQAADGNDKAALRQLEDNLTMEEIAHFRAFVAARCSTLLMRSETHLQHAIDAVDAVVANLGMFDQCSCFHYIVAVLCGRSVPQLKFCGACPRAEGGCRSR